ncbi:glycosyltransferase family 2 protein [Mucilaginibacter boryungensis]|uniref:Glycosyltransferase n=1 Tax=Mucilaginibacter boryungensis TaxID=768480 RepID=A0ABR9XH80_9SPHI|nr:glycosyltransferase [Mucilaginibacter boryungensis]MBE9666358.1 glycosyltransferase [Mucilaginibacter boryungensis]
MHHKPSITVLMPAYNAGKYIGEAIQSVLQQTFVDFELLIVNDGSTDGTLAVINSFDDKRIVVINQQNKGIAEALNTGLKYAKGAYIARFDADDICYPERLQKQYDFLTSYPDYVMVGSDADYILEDGDFLFHFQCIAHTYNEVMDKLYFYCPFIHPAVMYRKDVICNAGGYSAHAHNFEDYLLWTSIAKTGKMGNLPEALIKYRHNPSSVTIDERWRGKRFRDLKRMAVKRGAITHEEGDELLAIIKRQDTPRIKEGSYHALSGKKYLAENYQLEKARAHIKKAIEIHPLRLDNYLLYLVSYLPVKIILWLHKLSPNKL